MIELASYILLFVLVGVGFIFIHLVAGLLVRPIKPDPEKLTVYECGEPTVGSAWVQFDLRYYVVALLFVIFDVEVAFFFPWAVVYGKLLALGDPTLSVEHREEVLNALAVPDAKAVAANGRANAEEATKLGWVVFCDLLIFFGLLLVGYIYLWRRGDLDWVRTTTAHNQATVKAEAPTIPDRPVLVAIGK